MYRIIGKDQYDKNVADLTKEYEKKKAEICKKYGIKPEHYDMIADILGNENFKNNINLLVCYCYFSSDCYNGY